MTHADIALVRDHTVPGAHGAVPVRLYHPGPRETLLPGVVYLHGGGFTFGDLDTHDHICRLLAERVGAAVIAVDYRLAPAHRYPAAVDDAFDATAWAAANAAALGLDADRLAIAGDSAGGNLAAAVTLLARDRGGPALVHQVLVYPVIDLAGYPAGDDTPYPSRLVHGEGRGLTSEGLRVCAERYLAAPEDALAAHASPIRAADLAGLPPALVVTGDLDPLRDEAEAYARALAAAGVPATTVRINGGVHGMFGMGALDPLCRPAEDAVASALHGALHGRPGVRLTRA